jgi:hypothetical protein
MLFVAVLEHGWYALGKLGSEFRVVPLGRKQSAWADVMSRKSKRREDIGLDISEEARER